MWHQYFTCYPWASMLMGAQTFYIPFVRIYCMCIDDMHIFVRYHIIKIVASYNHDD